MGQDFSMVFFMEKITRILESKLIPQLRQAQEHPFIVARSEMHVSNQPYGVTLTPRPIIGKRVVQRSRRTHNNQRLHIANYPDANLQEIALPKLACIVGGEADYLLSKYSVRCREGSIILIPPRIPHQTYGPFLSEGQLKTGSCNLLQVQAFSNGINIWLSDSHHAGHTADYADYYFIYNRSATNIFNTMMAASIDAKPHWEIVSNGLLIAFFAIVLQEIKGGRFTRKGTSQREEISPSSPLKFADQVCAYIESNCHKPLKLDDAATYFFMSVSQFTRRLRQEGNGTFVEILTAARIEQAKKLLIETELTFTAIADYCSFRSNCYFRTQFIKYVSCTPSEYRKRHKTAL